VRDRKCRAYRAEWRKLTSLQPSVIEARLVHDLALRGQTVATIPQGSTLAMRSSAINCKERIADIRSKTLLSYAVSGHSGWSHAHAISTSSFPASLQMSPQ
jgi:hypothetical protein